MSDQSDLPLFKMFQKAEPVAPVSPPAVQAAGSATETLAASTPSAVPEIATEPQILSIEELNVTIKKMLEGQLHLIWVRGEISNFKAHSSGHFYFSLKDAKSQISAVMFRGYNSRLRFKPADGVEVIVRGRISVYECLENQSLDNERGPRSVRSS
jgi:hypothetical protein